MTECYCEMASQQQGTPTSFSHGPNTEKTWDEVDHSNEVGAFSCSHDQIFIFENLCENTIWVEHDRLEAGQLAKYDDHDTYPAGSHILLIVAESLG